MSDYRGRVAPTPTGLLHLGHAATFLTAQKRARENNGTLIFRNEDLDQNRCKNEFIEAAFQDLNNCGIFWQEGPDVGGPFAPYNQSERLDWYQNVWEKLKDTGTIYPCDKSRKDVAGALQAPHNDNNEPLFPVELRPPLQNYQNLNAPGETNWRFRVPENEVISFHDNNFGKQTFIGQVDFGDFLIWRKDGFPSYELAVVADDHSMKISEVVRGADLLISTARQILLYRALKWEIPQFYHCPLINDENGQRLAKRNNALAIRTLFTEGKLTSSLNKLQNHYFY